MYAVIRHHPDGKCSAAEAFVLTGESHALYANADAVWQDWVLSWCDMSVPGDPIHFDSLPQRLGKQCLEKWSGMSGCVGWIQRCSGILLPDAWDRLPVRADGGKMLELCWKLFSFLKEYAIIIRTAGCVSCCSCILNEEGDPPDHTVSAADDGFGCASS